MAANFRAARRVRRAHWFKARLALIGALSAVAVAACGSSSSSSATSKSASASAAAKPVSGQVPASAKQTIVFAVQGGAGASASFGGEGEFTEKEIVSFEKAHPNITVKPITISGSSVEVARSQVQNYFLAGDSTPDVIDSDQTWVAPWARAGWIAPLDQAFGARRSQWFPAAVAAGTYNHHLYALSWYYNAEGLYYNTSLVHAAPTTPQQVVAEAHAALQADPSLKAGFAFDGYKDEGLVTLLTTVLGHPIDVAHLDNPATLKALQYIHDLVYKYGVTPKAVVDWQLPATQPLFTNGQAAMLLDWPYVYQIAESKGSKVIGKTAYIPFPSVSGVPAAAVGGDMLTVNAHTKHMAAVIEFLQWLETPANQTARAIFSGDPPSLLSAYTPALFKAAPYFRQEVHVFKVAVARPVNPNYEQITADLQNMISSVLANQQSPAQALQSTAQQVAPLASSS
ncbi:MAG TPA: extracellular solute-binding protein [Solirubrobacteraceae bacterium]|nr:extracellular solute-binding protein [Solirubrobacteraceae bacterium]